MSHTDEMQAAWDAMASNFAKHVEPFSVNIARGLISMLEIGAARSVLEIGAGAGAGAMAMAEQLAPEATMVITDLSASMLNLAKLRVDTLNRPNITLQTASSEALPFEDARFDRTLACLNLMIAENPRKALSETFRVLQPGGLAAWSVWGRPKNSPLMMLPDQAMEKAGIHVERPPRSNFHLGRRKKLIRHIEKAGFEHVICWHQHMVMPFATGADFAASTLVTLPRLARMMASQPEEKREKYLKHLARLADRVLEQSRPIGLEVLMAVARKPAVYADEREVVEQDEVEKRYGMGEE